MSLRSSLKQSRWMKSISEASGRINGKSFEMLGLNKGEEPRGNSFSGYYVATVLCGVKW